MEIANGDRGWAILVQGAKRGFSHSCCSHNPSIAKDLTRGVEGRGTGENSVPFSSGFTPLVRPTSPRDESHHIHVEAPPTYPEEDNPPSSATHTLSRHSRGFIPLLRALFQVNTNTKVVN